MTLITTFYVAYNATCNYTVFEINNVCAIIISLLSNKKQPKTYSKTEESFWSPQMSISAIDLKVSTNKPRLCSDTVWFLESTLYKYFRCSKECKFFGRPQPPPNQLLLLNIFFFWTCHLLTSIVFDMKRKLVTMRTWTVAQFY